MFSENFNFGDKVLKIKRNFESTDRFFKDNYKVLRDIAIDCCKKDENNDRLKNTYGPLPYLDEATIILLAADFFGKINPTYEEMFWDNYYDGKINYSKNVKYSKVKAKGIYTLAFF